MMDLGFVVAGYGVILGGIALYAAFLLRRLRTARAAEADSTLTPDSPR